MPHLPADDPIARCQCDAWPPTRCPIHPEDRLCVDCHEPVSLHDIEGRCPDTIDALASRRGNTDKET